MSQRVCTRCGHPNPGQAQFCMVWGLAILYGLWAAVRCLGGRDFKYIVVGRWTESLEQ